MLYILNEYFLSCSFQRNLLYVALLREVYLHISFEISLSYLNHTIKKVLHSSNTNLHYFLTIFSKEV